MNTEVFSIQYSTILHMEVYCTRPNCPRPQNYFGDLDDSATLKTVQQKYCTTCGMPLILVGRYLSLKLLGRGGFGAAFLARDRYTPGMRRCVVKQFKPAFDLTATQLEIAQNLFEREAEVLEELGNQHDQIPDLFAFFELTVPSLQPAKQDKFFYLVQEFIDGKNLDEELAEKGKFSEAEVLKVLRAILPVLKFVHENGSIHRDIKPSNIMRHRNGKLYLLDFGAVKQVTKAAGVATSRGSTGIYSIGFAPPEQMAGGEVYPSTDLYALAVTCLTLLTSKEPTELFDAYSNQWNWRMHSTVSDRLADVLDRLLMIAPNQRFQSAASVMAALTPAKTPPPPPSTPINPPLQVPPSPPTTTTSGITPLSPQYSQQTQQPQPLPGARSARPAFSTLELLAGAAFSGFEGGLIAIALTSLLGTTLISSGLWLLILGGLILAQSLRMIEKANLAIIAGITLAIILFFPALRTVINSYYAGNPIQVVVLPILTGLLAIALTALFRLVYKLLLNLF
jgi:serine/threonine-protein kinase